MSSGINLFTFPACERLSETCGRDGAGAFAVVVSVLIFEP